MLGSEAVKKKETERGCIELGGKRGAE